MDPSANTITPAAMAPYPPPPPRVGAAEAPSPPAAALAMAPAPALSPTQPSPDVTLEIPADDQIPRAPLPQTPPAWAAKPAEADTWQSSPAAREEWANPTGPVETQDRLTLTPPPQAPVADEAPAPAEALVASFVPEKHRWNISGIRALQLIKTLGNTLVNGFFNAKIQNVGVGKSFGLELGVNVIDSYLSKFVFDAQHPVARAVFNVAARLSRQPPQQSAETLSREQKEAYLPQMSMVIRMILSTAVTAAFFWLGKGERAKQIRSFVPMSLAQWRTGVNTLVQKRAGVLKTLGQLARLSGQLLAGSKLRWFTLQHPWIFLPIALPHGALIGYYEGLAAKKLAQGGTPPQD